MKIDRIWHGVRLRQIESGADPDAPRRVVRLPAAWDDAAAAALCALSPGEGRIDLPALARSWINPIAVRARDAGLTALATGCTTCCCCAAARPRWASGGARRPMRPGFVLNLPAFHDATAGFDVAAFAEAVDTAAQALQLLAPGPYAIAMADLAGLLAALGLDYATKAARDVALCLAALLRGRADAVLAGPQPDLLARVPTWPAPPATCAAPGLAEAAAAARVAALRSGGVTASTAILTPGPVEALLGCETGGIAPAFAPVGPIGLSRSAQAWLAARGIGLEAALAAALAGEPVFPVIRTSRPRRHARRPGPHAPRHAAAAPQRRPCTIHGASGGSARAPPGLHAEGGDRRPPDLPAYRGVCRRAPRRDRHRPAAGERIRPRPGRQLRHRRQHRVAARRAARQLRRGLRPDAVRPVRRGRGRPGGRSRRLRPGLRGPQPRRELSGPPGPRRRRARRPVAAEAPLLPLDLPRGARRPALRLVAG